MFTFVLSFVHAVLSNTESLRGGRLTVSLRLHCYITDDYTRRPLQDLAE